MQAQFHDRIAQLVFTFPEDAATSTGTPFWSPPKRFPHALTFSADDASQVCHAYCTVLLCDAVLVTWTLKSLTFSSMHLPPFALPMWTGHDSLQIAGLVDS